MRQRQPNDVDRKRLQRALEKRLRYRYVRPQVAAVEDGYLVSSPCCSRNVNPRGDVIEIAWLAYTEDNWLLRYRDHAEGCWIRHSEHATLQAALQPLLEDPSRVFWP